MPEDEIRSLKERVLEHERILGANQYGNEIGRIRAELVQLWKSLRPLDEHVAESTAYSDLNESQRVALEDVA